MKCPKCGIEVSVESSFCSNCGSSLLVGGEVLTKEISQDLDQEPLTFASGDSFGKRYRIVEEIGRGGMGKVYKAEDIELGIVVALKMIHPEFLSNLRMITRFKKEILLAREITHENVVRIHDFGEVKGVKFITMQYIDGKNLKELVQEKSPMGVNKALDLLRQICKGLETAHKKGIVHRDLKPQNIMVDKKGKAFITDFGLAKSIEGQDLSISGTVIGTPEYISPEQACGGDVDPRSDIYTFGVIMYEMMTGSRPFKSDTALGYLQKHLYENPQTPSKINPRIPSFLESMIQRCMEKDLKKRYQNINEIINDFKDERITSKPIISRYRARRLFTIIISAVLIIAVGLGVYFLIKGKKFMVESVAKKKNIKSVAVVYFDNISSDKSVDHWARAIPNLLITDLSQSRYLHVLPENRLYQILKDINHLKSYRYSSEVLEKIAASGNVDYIILGSYISSGEIFNVTVKIWQSGRDDEISMVEKGRGTGSLFSIVDRLTKKVKYKFNLSLHEITGDYDLDVGQITTRSPKALEHYIEGQKFYNEGKFEDGIQAFERATKIDPKFAMAYRNMAWSYAYLGDIQNRKKSFLKTLELRDHLSERERYLIEGDVYGESEETYNLSIQAYKKLVERYPDDYEGNQNLGLAYYFIEEWDHAIECYEICRRNMDPSIHTYTYLAYAYMAKGMYKKARNVLDDFKNHFFDNVELHKIICFSYIFEGKFELALIELNSVLSKDREDFSLYCSKGVIFHLKGDFYNAEKEYKKVLNFNDNQLHLESICSLKNLNLQKGKLKECIKLVKKAVNLSKEYDESYYEKLNLIDLIYLNLKTGNYKEALKTSTEILRKSKSEKDAFYQRIALYYQSLAYLQLDQIKKASETAESLKIMVNKGIHKNHIKFYYYIKGLLSQKNGEFDFAIECFKKAILLLPHEMGGRIGFCEHALFIDALASVYIQHGDDERACKEYEKIHSLTSGRLHYGDIYVKSFYNLANIYQKNGWRPSKAVEYYETFIDLWKDADPDIKEIEDAKKQLKLLKGK